MIGRYVFAIVTGTLVTLSLFFIMHLLIEFGESAISEEREGHTLDFVRIKRNENLNTEDITPEKPAKPPEVPPEIPPPDLRGDGSPPLRGCGGLVARNPRSGAALRHHSTPGSTGKPVPAQLAKGG